MATLNASVAVLPHDSCTCALPPESKMSLQTTDGRTVRLCNTCASRLPYPQLSDCPIGGLNPICGVLHGEQRFEVLDPSTKRKYRICTRCMHRLHADASPVFTIIPTSLQPTDSNADSACERQVDGQRRGGLLRRYLTAGTSHWTMIPVLRSPVVDWLVPHKVDKALCVELDTGSLSMMSKGKVGNEVHRTFPTGGPAGLNGFRVTHRFSSASHPCLVELLAIGTGVNPTKVLGTIFVKRGAILSNDMFAMQMVCFFNHVWRGAPDARKNALFCGIDDGARPHHVSIATYAVHVPPEGGKQLDLGYTSIIPDFTPCMKMRNRNWPLFMYNPELNEFRYSAQVLATLAGALIHWYVLGIGDRHQDNMGFSSLGFVGLDFGFICGLCPTLDTKDFPLPWMAYVMMDDNSMFAKFCSACHEALVILQENKMMILSAADRYLVAHQLGDKNYVRSMNYISDKLHTPLTKQQLESMMYKGSWWKVPKDISHWLAS